MNRRRKPSDATLKLRDRRLRTQLDVCPPSDRDREDGT